MKQGLWNLAETVTLSTHLDWDVLPAWEPVTIKNVTLDGNPHYQTVGTPARYMDVVLYCTRGQMFSVNQYAAEKQKVKLYYFLGPTQYWYEGYIDEQPDWSVSAYNYYQGKIRIYRTDSG